MAAPVTDRASSLAALHATSSGFTSMLRSISDPTPLAIGRWSIGETAAHMSHLFGVFADIAAGGSSPITDHLALDEAWNAKLDEDLERDPQVLADRIDTATERFSDLATPESWEQMRSWHGDIKLPTYALASLLINEAAIHGRDVATAESRPWDLSADHARIIITGIMSVLPHFVDETKAAGFSANYELKLRGPGGGFLSFRDGVLEVSSASPGKIDCHISADPVAYLLIGYGRVSQIPALLSGKVLAWGRKPWLGPRFAKLFHSV